MRILAAAILAATVLTACQWVEPPPDMRAQDVATGALIGCIRTHVYAVGVPSPLDRERIEQYCAYIAAESLGIWQQGQAPEPERSEGSEL